MQVQGVQVCLTPTIPCGKALLGMLLRVAPSSQRRHGAMSFLPSEGVARKDRQRHRNTAAMAPTSLPSRHSARQCGLNQANNVTESVIYVLLISGATRGVGTYQLCATPPSLVNGALLSPHSSSHRSSRPNHPPLPCVCAWWKAGRGVTQGTSSS